jgi:PAS domain S-box-containing protein
MKTFSEADHSPNFVSPRSEEEYRILFDGNPCPMYVCDEETLNFLAVNDATVNHYGYAREEFLRMHIKDIRPADEVPALLNYISKHTGSHAFAGVWKHRKKDGTIFDVEVSWHKVRFAGRRAYLVLISDITAREQAEVALRESEVRYRELFENANDLIYTHDLNGNFTSLNKSGERLTGYTQAEALTMNVSQVVAPEQLSRARSMMARKTETHNAPTVYELDIIAKSGERISLELSTRLIYRNGKPFGVQGIGRDITDRRLVQAEIIQRNQELAGLNEIGQELSKLAEPAEIAKLIHTVIGKVLDNRNLYVALYDEEKQEVSFPAYTIDGEPYYSPTRKLGHGLTEYVVRTRQPLFIRRDLKSAMARLGLVSNARQAECWLAVPMLVGDKAVGVITIQDYEKANAYNDQHLKLLSTIASQAASALVNARLYAEMKQQAERAALTSRISLAVRRTLDVSEVFQTAVRELGAHLEVDRCSLFVIDQKTGRAMNIAEYVAPGVAVTAREFDLPHFRALISEVEKHGVLRFDDVAGDESIKDVYEDILKQFNVKSIMYVGVSVGDELLGAFALSTIKQTRSWSNGDSELARAVADQTGIAIRQAKLYEQAEATSIREQLANKLSLAIRASLSLDDVLTTATRELGTALSASRVQVRLCDVASREPATVHEFAATNSGALGKIENAYDDFLRRHFLRSPKPLVIDDALHYEEGSPEFNRTIREHAENSGILCELNYPLSVSGQYRGAISIHQAGAKHQWTRDEVSLVESVAIQLATGIAQAELFQLVERGKKDWETTFDAMSDGIFIFDRTGRLMRVNSAGAAMEDTTPNSLLGRKCCDILSAGDGEVVCVVERAVKQGVSINLEVMPKRLNRPLLVNVEPVVDKNKKIISVVATARDISELRKAEAFARERQTLLQNILESAREAIYALDMDGRYQWCNQAMLDMTGFTTDEIIGHDFLERTHEDDREMRKERFASVLTGEPQSYESRYVARDGQVRYCLVNNAPIVVDGRITGVLGIARDNTEQKQERERAARADKLRALGQLASGVAHDFNNSLAAILGRAQLMLRQVQDESLIRNLGILVTAAEDAAATVRRIQTFARKSQIKEFELLDVNGLLHDAVEITRTRWQNEARAAGVNIETTLNCAPDLFTMGNASELREVFVNLIVNASDAMPQGGQLKICAARNGDRLRLRFADNGTGMAEEVRERVFEPFYTTKGVQGTGLGLAVSYGIIERHEGSISVESKLGEGTTFLIYLNAAEPAEAEVVIEDERAGATSLSVLVIDDEPVVRDTLAEMLTDLDHRVVTAGGGREGLAKVASGDFDLVFTDLAMPEMDGWETAREIRKQRPELPVVLVTGYAATAHPPEGELDLVNEIISKPFDFDQVTGTLARVCNGFDARA